MSIRSLVPCLLLALGACASPEAASETVTSAPRRATVSVATERTGSVLDALDPSELERNLDAARAAFAADPHDETNAIWLGRRLAYLGRYEDAVEIYSQGLREHPQSFRLLRHRGHRFITLRRFARAETDLEQAATLIYGVRDEVEPDGAPNAYGVPRSTNHSNVYYHLGLALYLQGRYEAALDAYEKGLAYAKVNDDMLVATTHWLYTTLRRLGRDDEAQAVVTPIHEGMQVLANDGYYQLLRLYRGWATADEVMDVEPGTVEFASRGYGVACWHRAEGREAEARALCERIVASGANPAAFGFIAAEVDLTLGP